MVQVTTEPAEKSPDHPTAENIIQFRPRPKRQPYQDPPLEKYLKSAGYDLGPNAAKTVGTVGVPSFTFDGFDPRDPDPA